VNVISKWNPVEEFINESNRTVIEWVDEDFANNDLDIIPTGAVGPFLN